MKITLLRNVKDFIKTEISNSIINGVWVETGGGIFSSNFDYTVNYASGPYSSIRTPDMIQLDEQSIKAYRQFIGTWHSHLNGPLSMSEEDRNHFNKYIEAFNGTTVNPYFIIISTKLGVVHYPVRYAVYQYKKKSRKIIKIDEQEW